MPPNTLSSGRRHAGAAPPIDPLEMRRCTGRFATGVVALTYRAPDGPRGITLNSFTSVSLDPPLVLVSIARTSRSHEYLADMPYAINILAAEQLPIALQFAGGASDLEIEWGGDAVPTLPNSLATITCEPWSQADGGDHTLFLGRVIELEYRSGAALAYSEGRFTSVPDLRRWVPRETLDLECAPTWM